MLITKDRMARDLAEKTGYYLKDIKTLLSAMDEQVKEYFAEVTDEDDVLIQICEGVKIGCSIIPERPRKNPRTQEDIICKPCCKPKTRYSQDFRALIQKNYEDKKQDE